METAIKETDVWSCRYCKAGKRNDVSDPDYCSGKCRGLDGAEALERSVATSPEILNQIDTGKVAVDLVAARTGPTAEPAPFGSLVLPGLKDDELKPTPTQPAPNPDKASYTDYVLRPYAYHRRLGAETLNWGEHLDLKQLQQAGLKKNRVAIPGDFDFEPEKDK